MTPREIAGTLFFAGRRKKRDEVRQLQLQAMAARGDPKAFKKLIKELEKD